jgi:hypothetical protein
MVLSPQNYLILLSTQVPTVIIDTGNCELYQLATLEYSGVNILPIDS